MTDKNKTPIPYRQYFKALIAILKRNYHVIILDTYISPNVLTFFFAVKYKNEKDWCPKIVEYYLDVRKVHILLSLNDSNPTIIDAATFLYMDENKITT